MKKSAPLAYAVAAFLAVPVAIVAMVLICAFIVAVLCGYWAVIPFLVFAVMRKHQRKTLGKLHIDADDQSCGAIERAPMRPPSAGRTRPTPCEA